MIPEVVDESAGGLSMDRDPKVGAVEYAAAYLQCAQAPSPGAALIALPLTGYRDTQIDSLLADVARAGISGAIVVGPSTSAETAEAKTSTMAALRRIADAGTVRTGAIAIHARPNEPARMVAKVSAGADYFVSQLFYDGPSMNATIGEYAEAARAAGQTPRRIFLSLAPVISTATARLMANVINPGRRLNGPAAAIPDAAVGPQSIEYLRHLIVSTIDAGASAGVPIGISVGHVTERNHRLSFELLAAVSTVVQCG